MKVEVENEVHVTLKFVKPVDEIYIFPSTSYCKTVLTSGEEQAETYNVLLLTY